VSDGERMDCVLGLMRDEGSVGPRARVQQLRQLEGGWSRQSWALTVDDPDSPPLELIVRVRPHGALLDTDLRQEFSTYAALADEPVPVPPVHGMLDEQDTPFGGPFFVMDRLPGRSPNVWRARERAELAEDWQGARGYATDLADTLAAIHAVPLEQLAKVVVARDFAATVAHWRAIQQEMALVEDPILEEAYEWVAQRAPRELSPCLVHGDYRIGNCLVDEGRLTGVLDWELSFLGDPRFDLGYVALEYHAGKFTKPGSPLLNAVAERDWFRERYEAASGRSLDAEVIRTFSVLAMLMLCAILTTGLHRYAGRETDDIRMAWTRFALPGLRQDMIALMGW
jgi:aminoglycoside phosphotransferase (APT) family kinase protein